MSGLEERWHALVRGEESRWWAPLARGGLEALGVLYGGVLTGYRSLYDLRLLRTTRLPSAVLSVGNLTLGGAGKTTAVRWLTRFLESEGLSPCILSYGYRAGSGEEVRVVADRSGPRLDPTQGGDEPAMLARSLPGVPVLAARRRKEAGLRAWEQFRPDAVVLDDAFQYWRLEKDLDLVLLHAEDPFGGGKVFPRGSLRERLSALRRADAVLITHADRVNPAALAELQDRLQSLRPNLVWAASRHAAGAVRELGTGRAVPAEAVRTGTWLAVSGLGLPRSFERTLGDTGVDCRSHPFPDHHPYTEDDLRAVRERVEREGLVGVVTTEKDSVKIRPEWLGDVPAYVLEVDLEFLHGRDNLEDLVRTRVAQRLAASRPSDR